MLRKFAAVLVLCFVQLNGVLADHRADDRQNSNRVEAPVITLAPGTLSGSLFENVVTVLKQRYYDRRFRDEVLPGLADQYREKARRAATLKEQREVVHEFLSRIPASHLGLLSQHTYRNIFNDLARRSYPMFGFHLTEIEGKHYATGLLEGGPADRVGIKSWDRVAAIDNIPVEDSPRLDWRSDDSYLTDDRDPPVRNLIAGEGDKIRVKVERKPGTFREFVIPADRYSVFEAAQSSARILKQGDWRFGYVHFALIHFSGVPELLRSKLSGDFSGCDGLILDLRGRGGSGGEVARILSILREYNREYRRPIVALVDRQSRSAKDVLAHELRRLGLARVVGERTAGAVIPANFADVGHDSVLMFPSFKLPRYTDQLELKPVDPDLFVERAGPYSEGKDPILEAGLKEAARLRKSGGGVQQVRYAPAGIDQPQDRILSGLAGRWAAVSPLRFDFANGL